MSRFDFNVNREPPYTKETQLAQDLNVVTTRDTKRVYEITAAAAKCDQLTQVGWCWLNPG